MPKKLFAIAVVIQLLMKSPSENPKAGLFQGPFLSENFIVTDVTNPRLAVILPI